MHPLVLFHCLQYWPNSCNYLQEGLAVLQNLTFPQNLAFPDIKLSLEDILLLLLEDFLLLTMGSGSTTVNPLVSGEYRHRKVTR